MEKALYENQILIASEIANNYEIEKNVRRYSATSKLICPDAECPFPILKYCHGDVRQAHFAHKNNCNCDYAQFDLNTTSEIKTICKNLFNHFKEIGFEVLQEVKLIPHHYTNLLILTPTGNKIALELGTSKTSIKNIEYLNKQFSNENILLNWIIVDDNSNITEDKNSFFLKRFLLNESPQKDVILISSFNAKITQYTEDKTEYTYNHQIMTIPGYSNIYSEEQPLSNLSIENDSITITGFHQRYKLWLSKKRSKFEELKKVLDERKQLQEIEKQKDEQIEKTQQSQIEQPKSIELKNIPDKFLNPTECIYNKSGFRIRLCLHCNKEILAIRFDPQTKYYDDNPNLGCCKECKKNNIPRKF